jgi:NAD(P)-dependent dehydrogenase (short-subunit alcohol dehydrogenase family)
MKTPVAFITGASRGIGRGIALALAHAGFDIVAAASKADPDTPDFGVYEVKSKIEAMGRKCLPVAGDIADLQTHGALVDSALNEFGKIDLLVNNAGISALRRDDLLTCSTESYDRVMDVNLRGPFFLSQRIAQQMVSQVKGGEKRSQSHLPAIIFITSISAAAASPNRAEYCISKAGLSMAAQNFAVRLAEHGINVYEVRPGIIESDMTSGVQEKYDRMIEEGLLLQPRWGTPEDVGKAVVALAEGAFQYATGAVIELGGGFGVQRL